MKTLTLLRHAKSTWDDPIARDFDRPLNPRGRRAACAVGREMKALGLAYDMALASPARRVAETLEEVQQAFGPLPLTWEQRIYLASTETLMELVRTTDDSAGRLLLVGHNPGLENLALLLTREEGGPLRGEVEIKYPTGTLAEIGLPVDRWGEVSPGRGTLARFIRPRDLDPELGPDRDSD
jgi:phosphohistidine phosphatase